MAVGRHEPQTKHDTLEIENGVVARWFMQLPPKDQDEWVQDVTSRHAVAVEGYTFSQTPTGGRLEIEYVYLG